MLRNQSSLNLSQVAKSCRADFSTVKQVYKDLIMDGSPSHYIYNHMKSQEEIEGLDRSLDKVTQSFATTTDLKRANPSFSKKKILKALKTRGFHWDRLRRTRKRPLYAPANPRHVREVIQRMVGCMADRTARVLYLDEMKFPLVQTPDRCWSNRENIEGEMAYNRRPVDEKIITAIALCSQEDFLAVQLYQGEVRGIDFLYFLTESIKKLDPSKSYLIVGDNASWHKSVPVQRSKAFKFLYFNVPHMFMLNLIESAFSFVRAGFRKRPTVETFEEEAKEIANIFFQPENRARFKGLLRNHYRVLKRYFILNGARSRQT